MNFDTFIFHLKTLLIDKICFCGKKTNEITKKPLVNQLRNLLFSRKFFKFSIFLLGKS